MNTLTQPNDTVQQSDKVLELIGTDYIEMYVGNALQAAHYYITAFGFQPLAYSGLETGNKEKQSYVVQQDKIRLVLTAPLVSGTSIGKHIDIHGDGVKAIAFTVEDAEDAYQLTMDRGAESALGPANMEDKNGNVIIRSIKTYGDTVHHFVERKKYKGVFLPGYKAWNPVFTAKPIGLKYIDHMVGNVGWNQMNKWVAFYRDVLGFTQIISFDDKDISTDYTALMSKVMSNGNGRIKFPINEPAEGKKKSQIEEYLDFNNGAGVQHIAVATDNILHTVNDLKNRGVEFLRVPDTYYDVLLNRVGEIEESIESLRKLGVLVDRDDEGYLLQIFTKPVVSRPTLFFEIIQRKGATSFGKGNFKALFEAIEREQESRGTL